jgi:hypothetical protein
MPTYRAVLYATFRQEVEIEAATPEEAQARMPYLFDTADAECDGVEVVELTETREETT